jgi:hypothetical protein
MRENNGGQIWQTEAFPEELTFETRHALSEALDRPLMVSRGHVCLTQVDIRDGLEGDIPKRLGAGESALARREGALLVGRRPEVLAHIGGNLPQPAMVVEGRGERVGFA